MTLVDGNYYLQIGEPLWMPEIGFGIGRCVLPSDRFRREVLSWFNQQGQRYLTGEEKADLEKYRADTEKYRADFESQKAQSEKQRAETLVEEEEVESRSPSIH